MDLCVALFGILWWGVQYFRSFPVIRTFEVYMKISLQDPCVAEREYVEAIGTQYTTTCNTLLTAQNEWSNAKQAIDTTIELVGLMTECCKTSCPYQNLNQSPFNITINVGHESMMQSYGFHFEKDKNAICGERGCKYF